MMKITIIDDFLPDPVAYREEALKNQFQSYHFEHCTFHGISVLPIDSTVPAMIHHRYSEAIPSLSFLRKSPAGQVEPHFIHSDIDMGQWSAVLYLNPDPPAEDGTSFWTHAATGMIGSLIPHERSKEGMTQQGWKLRGTVWGKFNRLALFPSSYFHSRSIHENWGSGDQARLTQVTFGTGDIV
jgi:hypothetical protein